MAFKGLKNLIRLHEWTVDEHKRGLGKRIQELEILEQRKAALEQEIRHEQALAAANPDGVGITYAAYDKAARDRRDDLDRHIIAQHREIEAARDRLNGAYMELKKYEQAQKARDKAAEIEQAKELQDTMDEMSAQQHRRHVT